MFQSRSRSWTCGRRSPRSRSPSSRRLRASRSTGEFLRAGARGVGFATLSHAAGLSSTGDAELDRRLPFDEFYRIPRACASAVEAAKSRSGRVIAIGTSVVRALEWAATGDRSVRPGVGLASGRIARGAKLRVVDAILTGVHQPGESHFELLQAFAGDSVLDRMRAEAAERLYRAHEFGDSLLIFYRR